MTRPPGWRTCVLIREAAGNARFARDDDFRSQNGQSLQLTWAPTLRSVRQVSAPRPSQSFQFLCTKSTMPSAYRTRDGRPERTDGAVSARGRRTEFVRARTQFRVRSTTILPDPAERRATVSP